MTNKKQQTPGEKDLQTRIAEFKSQGKDESQITYGMLNDGFKSLSGIPDDFCSAEDPSDRVKLWNERSKSYTRSSGCGCGGSCSSCDPTYTD